MLYIKCLAVKWKFFPKKIIRKFSSPKVGARSPQMRGWVAEGETKTVHNCTEVHDRTQLEK